MAQGICKHVNFIFSRHITELVVRIWKKDPCGEQLRGPLSTTQSDGAGVLTLARHVLFNMPFLISPGSDVGAAQADADDASGAGLSSGSGAAHAGDDAGTTPGAARVVAGYLHRALAAPSRRCTLFRQPAGFFAIVFALQTALV